MNSLHICVPYDFVVDNNTSGFDLIVYSYLSMMTFNKYMPDSFITTENLSYAIYNQKKKISALRDSMNKIIQLPQLSNSYQISKNGYLIHQHDLRLMQNQFIYIPFEYIDKIMKSSYAYKAALIKTLYLIRAGRDLNEKNSDNQLYITKKPEVWFCQCMNISTIGLISKYLIALEKLEIIYIIRSYHQCNVISLIEDKEQLIQYAVTKHNKEFSKNHSMMSKYYWLTQGKEYSPEETQEIKQFIISYNTKLENKAKQDPSGDYLSKRKDISIFT